MQLGIVSVPRARARVIAFALICGAGVSAAHAASSVPPAGAAVSDSTRLDSVLGTRHSAVALGDDSLYGRSGKLRARFLAPRRPSDPLSPEQLFGDSSDLAGIHAIVDRAVGGPALTFITMRPFSDKVKGRIGQYLIGFWPGERRAARGAAYANPEGFVEVTRENQDLHVSEHFRLRDFLTHDQGSVWPKYIVLNANLLDKLELVIADLQAQGIRVSRVRVMSGFRTPQYNANGGNTAGRSSLSRHMYGDAADVFVDNDGNGRMDDLNGDRRVDARDAAVILAAAERVERKHPDLVGGVGVYRATRSHGPFAHIDVRGRRARWGKTS